MYPSKGRISVRVISCPWYQWTENNSRNQTMNITNSSHYLLHCHHILPFVLILRIVWKTFVVDFESLSDSKKVEIILYGDSRCDDNQNNSVLSASINFVKNAKRFDCSFLIKITFFRHLAINFFKFNFSNLFFNLIYNLPYIIITFSFWFFSNRLHYCDWDTTYLML